MESDKPQNPIPSLISLQALSKIINFNCIKSEWFFVKQLHDIDLLYRFVGMIK